MGELTEYERLISIRIMQEDAESIYSLLQTERDPIFARIIFVCQVHAYTMLK